eukprot:6206250-Pleurochrysis_carterae.AAC.1
MKFLLESRREHDGVVGGTFADADVIVARKHKTKLVVRYVRMPCFWNMAFVDRKVAHRPGHRAHQAARGWSRW